MRLHFVCVGGNKCGTTWLYEMVAQHPQIAVAENKEPHYFSANYDCGADWYESNWRRVDGLRGEFSTSYLYDDRALERLVWNVPDVRILVLLRHPIDRAESHFRHRLRGEKDVDYQDFLASHPEILTNSLYGRRFAKLEDLFAADRVFVIYFDDIHQRPVPLLRSVFRFLSVNPTFVPEGHSEPVGQGFTPWSRALEGLRSRIYRFLKKKGFYRAIRAVKRTGIPRLYRILNDAGTDEDRIRAIREVLGSRADVVLRDLEKLESSALLSDPNPVRRWRDSLTTEVREG